jgi:hypothetical protein
MRCQYDNFPCAINLKDKRCTQCLKDKKRDRTNEERLSGLSTENKAEILNELFYDIEDYTNSKYYIEKWLKEKCGRVD